MNKIVRKIKGRYMPLAVLSLLVVAAVFVCAKLASSDDEKSNQVDNQADVSSPRKSERSGPRERHSRDVNQVAGIDRENGIRSDSKSMNKKLLGYNWDSLTSEDFTALWHEIEELEISSKDKMSFFRHVVRKGCEMGFTDLAFEKVYECFGPGSVRERFIISIFSTSDIAPGEVMSVIEELHTPGEKNAALRGLETRIAENFSNSEIQLLLKQKPTKAVIDTIAAGVGRNLADPSVLDDADYLGKLDQFHDNLDYFPVDTKTAVFSEVIQRSISRRDAQNVWIHLNANGIWESSILNRDAKSRIVAEMVKGDNAPESINLFVGSSSHDDYRESLRLLSARDMKLVEAWYAEHGDDLPDQYHAIYMDVLKASSAASDR